MKYVLVFHVISFVVVFSFLVGLSHAQSPQTVQIPTYGFCNGVSILNCSNCATGTYRTAACTPSSDTVCSACPAGSNCSNNVITSTRIPSYGYCNGSAVLNCTSCSAGTYQSLQCTASRNSVCDFCPPNNYCPAGSVTPRQCTVCDQVTLTSCSSPGLSSDTVTCACNPGFYLANPQAQVKCTACPLYTTTVANNTDSSVFSCRCIAGYVCTYTKRIYVMVTLNIPLSQFDAAAQESFKQTVAAAANVTSDKVTIVGIYSPPSSGGGNRRLLAFKDLTTQVKANIEGTDNLHHETIRKFRIHSKAPSLLVSDVEWKKEEFIKVEKLP